VLTEYRPTLREALAPHRRVRRAAVALGALLLLCAAWVGWHVLHPGIGVSGSRPFAYHFRRPAALRPLPPGQGELVHLEQRRRGRVLNEFTVAPLRLPPYTGDAAGVLALVADRDLETLRARFPGLQPVAEGYAKLADMPGHELRFRVPGHPRTYGREVLIPRPGAGSRVGVRLLMLAKPSGDVAGSGDLGVHGLLRLPYRSFRFG
jgi:hypothetical protein